jgi:excisionase family DNA binding protein
MDELDPRPPLSPDPADTPATEPTPAGEPATGYAGAKRIRLGAACAPPPRMPPGYTPPPVPDYLFTKMRPEAWTCRACCSFWDWVYRPPTEDELDGTCAVCSGVLRAEERKVEVNRLLLARLRAGDTWDVPAPVGNPRPSASIPGEVESSPGGACTVDEAGRRLGCKRTVVFKLLREKRLLAAPKLGRKRMVLRSSVDALLEAGGVSRTAPVPKKDSRVRGPRAGNGQALAAEIAKLPVE